MMRELEEKYNINILFGSIIVSLFMDLSNNTSDIDFYSIFQNKNHNEFNKLEIDTLISLDENSSYIVILFR